MGDLRRQLLLLRYDALQRGMTDLAIVYGWSAMRLGSEMPTERVPVMQYGQRVGTLPGDFDPDNIKTRSFLYDPRPGDLRREGDVWVASRTLGASDLDLIVGFERVANGE